MVIEALLQFGSYPKISDFPLQKVIQAILIYKIFLGKS